MQSIFENYIEQSDRTLNKNFKFQFGHQTVVLKYNLFALNYSGELFTCINEMFYCESA